MAENVIDHGATGDGSTDDTNALMRAADAAGPGGEVFLPSGTYLVGRNNRVALDLSTSQYDGLTWNGEDADNTSIVMSGGQTRVHFIFLIKCRSQTIQNLTLDGQKDKQPTDRPGLCILTDGSGQFTIRDCYLNNSRNSALKHSGNMTSLIERCHFDNSGYPSNGGHAIAPNQSSERTTEILKCGFTNQEGADIDVGMGQDSGAYPALQTVIIEDCYAEGNYRGFLKFSDSTKEVIVRRCITIGDNDTEIPYKANPGTPDIGTITVEDSVIDRSKFPGIDLPRPGTLRLDNVAIKNTGLGGFRRGAGLYTDKMDIDAGEISVHGTDVLVEFIGSASGSIDSIIHEGQPLGRDNGIVQSTRQGSPLNPPVPTLAEVGPYASGGGGGGGGDDGKLLVIRGTGVPTNYRITVDGSITEDSDVESWDVISGGSVQGWVTETADVDRFRIDGEITDIEFLEGDAVVTVDGEEVETDPIDNGGNGGGETPARSGISGTTAVGLLAVGVGLAYVRQQQRSK